MEAGIPVPVLDGGGREESFRDGWRKFFSQWPYSFPFFSFLLKAGRRGGNTRRCYKLWVVFWRLRSAKRVIP